MTFDTSKLYATRIFGHVFSNFPEAYEPELPGTFAENTTTADGVEYAVFTVAEPEGKAFPAAWVGTFRINADFLLRNPPQIIGDAPDNGEGE